MNCADAQQLLHAYLDDELDPADAGRMNAHLLQCRECAQAMEAMKAVKIAVGNSALRHAAPAALQERIAAVIPTASAGPARVNEHRSIWRVTALAASVLLIATLSYFGLTRLRPGDSNELALLSLHLRSMQLPEHLVDVVSTDQHTVKPWFDGKIDFAPPVWQLANSGYPLVGGRVDYLGHRPAAALVYRRALHVINLFIWPVDGSSGDDAPSHHTVSGYNIVQWNADGLTFCAISDVNAADLQKFAELFRTQR